MSEHVELTNPVELSVGGMGGHILRRAIHLGMSFLPLIYFEWGESVADSLDLTLPQFVSCVVFLLFAAEGTRLKFGLTIYGQREYEARQISALGWGAFGIGLVFLLAPTEEYIWPLILSLSLGDPFLGEMRRKGMTTRNVIVSSTLFLFLVWVACWHFVQTPLWLAFLFAPLCVASEWPRLRYIDDNATMVLIPLGMVLLLEPFLGLL
ncbi:hypothetical protein N9X79_00165 [Euryarchaeota archaeon]|nr:hypothetical protein [Euryarchaeota archaeon]MDA8701357.1 hypothetical protein [Euryarchaeota archaeon]MDA9829163.1 hypothetical protein [Candidatus Poseidoniaceae archaeon]MDB2570559.1 hypothetical protein [Euryarchaeota archaeon]MDC3236546.1 hypothetical protein [Candidatus Poseidoniaceae archaeon]